MMLLQSQLATTTEKEKRVVVVSYSHESCITIYMYTQMIVKEDGKTQQHQSVSRQERRKILAEQPGLQVGPGTGDQTTLQRTQLNHLFRQGSWTFLTSTDEDGCAQCNSAEGPMRERGREGLNKLWCISIYNTYQGHPQHNGLEKGRNEGTKETVWIRLPYAYSSAMSMTSIGAMLMNILQCYVHPKTFLCTSILMNIFQCYVHPNDIFSATSILMTFLVLRPS